MRVGTLQGRRRFYQSHTTPVFVSPVRTSDKESDKGAHHELSPPPAYLSQWIDSGELIWKVVIDNKRELVPTRHDML